MCVWEGGRRQDLVEKDTVRKSELLHGLILPPVSLCAVACCEALWEMPAEECAFRN